MIKLMIKDLRPGDLVRWTSLSWFVVSIVARHDRTFDVCYLLIYDTPHRTLSSGLYRVNYIDDPYPLDVIR